MNSIEALRKTVDLQKQILKEAKDFLFNPDILMAIEKLDKSIPCFEENNENKYQSKIIYVGGEFYLIQPIKGGKYILWGSDIDPNGIQCGVGFAAENSNYIEEDLFLSEQKITEENSKDLDLYLFQDPYTEDCTSMSRIYYKDIKEALEIE